MFPRPRLEVGDSGRLASTRLSRPETGNVMRPTRMSDRRRLPLEGLPLGWRQSESQDRLGFFPTSIDAPTPEPIAYSGDAHLITVAPTGAGKGRSVVIPTLLTYDGPVVVLDIKGELFPVTARRRREMGHDVYCLDPFGVIDRRTSDSLNPLDLFTLPGADLESDAQMLATLLAAGNRGVKDPFWDLGGCGLHSGLIAHLGALHQTDRQGFARVCNLLMSGNTASGLTVLLDTVGKEMPALARREIAAFLQLSERDTRPGVLATAQSYVKPLHAERVTRTLEQSTIPLDGVVRGDRMTIYIVIPPDKLESHKGLLKLWVGTLLKAVTARRRVPDVRTLFLLDEIAQVGHFPLLETAVTLCRGYGLQVWTFWQDLAQLQSLYPTSWTTILNNSGVVQLFGVNNRRMASDWADYLPFAPELLLSLGRERQVLMAQGQEAEVAGRLDYLRDPAFVGLADPNPFFVRASIGRER